MQASSSNSTSSELYSRLDQLSSVNSKLASQLLLNQQQSNKLQSFLDTNHGNLNLNSNRIREMNKDQYNTEYDQNYISPKNLNDNISKNFNKLHDRLD